MTRLARSEVLDPNEVAVAENWGQSIFLGVDFGVRNRGTVRNRRNRGTEHFFGGAGFISCGGDGGSWVGFPALFSQEVE